MAQVPPQRKGGWLYGDIPGVPGSVLAAGLWLLSSLRRYRFRCPIHSQSLCHSNGHTSGPETLSYNRVEI